MDRGFRQREVFDETGQGWVHLAGLFEMVRGGVLGPDVFVMIPAVVTNVDVARAAILLEQVAGENRRQADGGVAVALAVVIRDAEGVGPAGVGEQMFGDGPEVFEAGDGLIEALVAATAGGAKAREQTPPFLKEFGRLLIEPHASQGFVGVEIEDGVTGRQKASRERADLIGC